MPLAPSVHTHTAGQLRLQTRPRPTPGTGEVLVKIHTVAICGSDTAYFRGSTAYTVTATFVMGHEASGSVAKVGEGVSTVAPGTRVAPVPSISCGGCEQCQGGLDNLCPHTRYLGSAAVDLHRDGALQEYLVVPVLPVDPSMFVKQLLGHCFVR